MPSPFPGMDPFLEHPVLFPDLHDSLIAYIREALQAKLREPYYNVIGSRVWAENSSRYVEPDVHVLDRHGTAPQNGRGSGSVATLLPTRTQPVVVNHVPQDEFHETFIEIQSNFQGAEPLVTIIEILSRAHKRPGYGRDQYLQKQQEILRSTVNLVEIGLLRSGPATTAVPSQLAFKQAGPFDYHACVHQFDRPGDYFVYPIRLQDKLPEVAIPLLPGDAAVPLDLRAVFDRAYDTGPYRRRVRYQEMNVEPPLTGEQMGWVRRVAAPV